MKLEVKGKYKSIANFKLLEMPKVIIQCSSSKNGEPFRWKGRSLKFVAQPSFCESSNETLFAHPDDRISGETVTWRDLVNDQSAMMSCYRSADLYKPPIYKELAETVGYENTFILSAGWGLVRGDFRLPDYDITFSTQGVEKSRRRLKRMHFNDFNQLPDSSDDCIVFVGKAYLPLVSELTRHYSGVRICYYKSNKFVKDSGIEYCKFETNHRTNWHYEAANAFLQDYRRQRN